MSNVTRSARRQRSYVRVQGPDAVEYLNRMLSNDVPEEGSVDALLLTPKARVIAPLLVWRRGADDVLLLTEPELGEAVRSTLLRSRFAAKCEIEPEEHTSTIVLGEGGDGVGISNRDYGVPAREVLDSALEGDADLERLRIEAATPRYGREIDDRVLPAEAGLEERAISFSKGCYPGQEPIARLHYRGHANRELRVLDVDAAEPGDEVRYGDKVVGRVTSAVEGLALAYIRTEVPDGAELEVAGRTATSRPRPS
jgi:tRNA-modifying protein YgfZ